MSKITDSGIEEQQKQKEETLKHYHVDISKISSTQFLDVFANSEEDAKEAAETSAYGGAGQYCFDDYEIEATHAELQADKPEDVKKAWIEFFGEEDADEMFTTG